MSKNRFDQSANDTGPADNNLVSHGQYKHRRLADTVPSNKRRLNLDRRIPHNERRVSTARHPETPSRRVTVDRGRILKGRRTSDHNGSAVFIPVPGRFIKMN